MHTHVRMYCRWANAYYKSTSTNDGQNLLDSDNEDQVHVTYVHTYIYTQYCTCLTGFLRRKLNINYRYKYMFHKFIALFLCVIIIKINGRLRLGGPLETLFKAFPPLLSLSLSFSVQHWYSWILKFFWKLTYVSLYMYVHTL